jgi:DNA-binding transcriptional regulator YiaG
MSTLVTSAAGLTKSATNFSNRRVSRVDVWIGSRVRIKRTSLGISEQEFSASLKINGNDLAAFEAGEKRINAALLYRIAKLIDVQPGYFFRGYTD